MSDPMLAPPACPQGMATLDKAFFHRVLRVPMVRFVRPALIGGFMKAAARADILQLSGVNHVRKLGSEKGVLLSHQVDVDKWRDQVAPSTVAAVDAAKATVESFEVLLDYSFWKQDEVLRTALPDSLQHDIPSGFTVTGHVAHYNLKEPFKKYGKLIGEVTLDKNPSIRTVVDKADTIATKFRTFPMVVLAGENDLVVEQHEAGCIFRFDFGQVYWNLRLLTEHARLVGMFAPGEVVADVMGGVGPFAVPAGKKHCVVLANDLNPASHQYLVENVGINKVGRTVRCFNLDGAEFIRESTALLQQWREELPEISLPNRSRHKMAKAEVVPVPSHVAHYVMNLPDSAITFLGAFLGAFPKGTPMPMVHVYCFEKYEQGEEVTDEELHARVHARILTYLETTAAVLPLSTCAFHTVRKVAPTKPMYCVSFRLPQQLGES